MPLLLLLRGLHVVLSAVCVQTACSPANWLCCATTDSLLHSTAQEDDHDSPARD